MQALLSFDKAPPFAAPLRFFLTAPLFAAAAGLLLAVAGEGALSSRWLPAALAATHLLTVGFMLQVMLGALIQILPVVAGANVPRPLAVATAVHGGLTVGALLLAAGFLAGSPAAFQGAAAILALTAAIFLATAGVALWSVPSTSPTIRGLKLALAALPVVVGLGAALAFGLAGKLSLPLVAVTDIHAAWGLGAWAGILLAVMSYVVVPMFQLTPGYPARLSWWLPVGLAGLFLLWSAAVALDIPLIGRFAQGAVALGGLAFAGLTAHLQHQRRRAKADATYRYWQLGLVSVALSMAMLAAAALSPALTEWAGWHALLAVLLVVGGFMSFIIGMLYKIVPFLAWLHLQNRGQGRVAAPNMNRILAEPPCQRQMRSHAAAVALLALAAGFPGWLAVPAGLALCGASLWLFLNLASALRAYRRHGAEVAERLVA